MKSLLTVLALALVVVTSSKAEAAQCSVDLKNGRGMTLDTFRGFGYDRVDACQEARRDCRRAIRAGYYRARYLECVEKRVIVERTCTATLVGRHGRTLDYFTARATGPRGTGVKGEACMKAERKCLRAQDRMGRHGRRGMRGTCIVEGRRGRVNPAPVPPRRGGNRGGHRRLVILDA